MSDLVAREVAGNFKLYCCGAVMRTENATVRERPYIAIYVVCACDKCRRPFVTLEIPIDAATLSRAMELIGNKSAPGSP